jgi:hypothetical protein
MLWFAQRVRELQEALSATIAREISSRNARAAALQKCWDGLRASFDVILDQGVDMADLPGGPSGILRRDYKRKEADRLVTRIDPGVVALLAELRVTSARRPRNRANGRRTSRSPSPSTPRRRRSRWPCSLPWRRLRRWSARRSSWRNREGRTTRLDQPSQALNRLRAMASLPKYSPPMPRPPTGDRGWMA